MGFSPSPWTLTRFISFFNNDAISILGRPECMYDVFQIPDYHEIIANPMDFGTVRKKLDCGAYVYLEQFEVCCSCYIGRSSFVLV